MERVKVLIVDEVGDTESIWAIPVGPDEFQIDIVPFFSFNVSHNDVVKVEETDGTLQVVRVVKKSGHRTVWADFDNLGGISSQVCNDFRDSLRTQGCVAEGLQPILVAIDVPPGIDVTVVTNELDRLAVDWDFGDPQPSVTSDYQYGDYHKGSSIGRLGAV